MCVGGGEGGGSILMGQGGHFHYHYKCVIFIFILAESIVQNLIGEDINRGQSLSLVITVSHVQ